jgi:hypothetical protein
MNISQDLKSHFSRLPKYITSRGIVFYDRKDYDNYIQQNEPSKSFMESIKCDYVEKYLKALDQDTSKR